MPEKFNDELPAQELDLQDLEASSEYHQRIYEQAGGYLDPLNHLMVEGRRIRLQRKGPVRLRRLQLKPGY